jgi:hypothetical protein
MMLALVSIYTTSTETRTTGATPLMNSTRRVLMFEIQMAKERDGIVSMERLDGQLEVHFGDSRKVQGRASVGVTR